MPWVFFSTNSKFSCYVRTLWSFFCMSCQTGLWNRSDWCYLWDTMPWPLLLSFLCSKLIKSHQHQEDLPGKVPYFCRTTIRTKKKKKDSASLVFHSAAETPTHLKKEIERKRERERAELLSVSGSVCLNQHTNIQETEQHLTEAACSLFVITRHTTHCSSLSSHRLTCFMFGWIS